MLRSAFKNHTFLRRRSFARGIPQKLPCTKYLPSEALIFNQSVECKLMSTNSSKESKIVQQIQQSLLFGSSGKSSPADEGTVIGTAGCVISCDGLRNGFIGSKVRFQNNCIGIVLQLNSDSCLIGVLPEESPCASEGNSFVTIGDSCYIEEFKTPTGIDKSPVQVITPAQAACERSGTTTTRTEDRRESMFLVKAPPSVAQRVAPLKHLSTGALYVETLCPVSKGQRILLSGAHRSGKTSILQKIAASCLMQHGSSDVVIYITLSPEPGVASWASKIEQDLLSRDGDSQGDTKLYVVSSNDKAFQKAPDSGQHFSKSLSDYLAPIVGLQLAIRLREQGKAPLVIFDDLERHITASNDVLEMMMACNRDTFSTNPVTNAALPLPVEAFISTLFAHACCSSGVCPPLTAIAAIAPEVQSGIFGNVPHHWSKNVMNLGRDGADSCIELQTHGTDKRIPLSARSSFDINAMLPWTCAPFQHPLLKFTARTLAEKLQNFREQEQNLLLRNELVIYVDFWEKEDVLSFKTFKTLLSSLSDRIFTTAEILLLSRALILYYFTSEVQSEIDIKKFQEGLLDIFKTDQTNLWERICAEFSVRTQISDSENIKEAETKPAPSNADTTPDYYVELLHEIDSAVAQYRFSFRLTEPKVN